MIDATAIRQRVTAIGVNMSVPRKELPVFNAAFVYDSMAGNVTADGAAQTFKELAQLTQDSAIISGQTGQQYSAHYQGPLQFPGFDTLGQMSQEPENHRIVGILAASMTQGGFRIVSTDNDKSQQEKCAILEQAIIHQYDILTHLRKLAEHDMNFGRGHLFVDVRMSDMLWSRDDENELKIPLGEGKIKKGQEITFKVCEPRWFYPMRFSANDVLSPDFYVPRQWFASPPGRYIDKSRAMPFISSPVPDLMKPAFFFAGAPLILLLKTYVENWQAARDGCAELLNRFSKLVLKSPVLAGDLGDEEVAQKLKQRYDLMAQTTNAGMILLDKGGGDGSEDEELEVVSVPLTGVTDLLKSMVEMLSLISGVPAMELWGDTPSGMNASGGDMMRVFANAIKSKQERLFGEHIPCILDYIQLSMFGEIDKTISWRWEPIDQLTAKEQAEVNKMKIDTDATAVSAGILDGIEVRERLAGDPNSGYMGLDVGAFSGDGAGDDLDNG